MDHKKVLDRAIAVVTATYNEMVKQDVIPDVGLLITVKSLDQSQFPDASYRISSDRLRDKMLIRSAKSIGTMFTIEAISEDAIPKYILNTFSAMISHIQSFEIFKDEQLQLSEKE
jgi:hypothetical protein